MAAARLRWSPQLERLLRAIAPFSRAIFVACACNFRRLRERHVTLPVADVMADLIC